MYLGVKKLRFLWSLLVREMMCASDLIYTLILIFIKSSVFFMAEKHCAPKDLSGIGGVVMRTWELLGECPRSLGKGRMWIWCCSFLGKSCPAFPPACPPHWGLNCMALHTWGVSSFPIYSARADKMNSQFCLRFLLLQSEIQSQSSEPLPRTWGCAIEQKSSFSLQLL